jgi:hypothetical protein
MPGNELPGGCHMLKGGNIKRFLSNGRFTDPSLDQNSPSGVYVSASEILREIRNTDADIAMLNQRACESDARGLSHDAEMAHGVIKEFESEQER